MKSALKLIISLCIASLFLWLTLKDQNWQEIYSSLTSMPLGWVAPFTGITLLSHFFRAERWKILVENEGDTTTRWTMLSGVMLGYLVNYTIPRLGEVSRCVYVAKKDTIKTSKLVGVVVMERLIDSVVLLAICFFVFLFIISDSRTLIALFGYDPTGWQTVLAIISFLIGGALGLYMIIRYKKAHPTIKTKHKLLGGVLKFIYSLIDGLVSIRTVKNWPYFSLLTIGMWVSYVLMTWFPMQAVTEGIVPELGILEALTVMAISSIGIVLPSPGGIGTYHFFVEKALTVLFMATSTHALTYAFASHTMMFLVILLSTPLVLIVNFFLSRTKTEQN